MKKAIVRIGFDYGYMRKEYTEKFPERTGYKVLTEDGMCFETVDNKFEDTENTIHLGASDIETEEGLNNGYYVPVRLKVTEDNVPHILLNKQAENAFIYRKPLKPDEYKVVARVHHLTDLVILNKENTIIQPVEIENEDGTFTKLTGDTVHGYLFDKPFLLIETEDNKFTKNEDENTIVLHEYINHNGFGEFYDKEGNEVDIKVNKDNKISIETVFHDTDYDYDF